MVMRSFLASVGALVLGLFVFAFASGRPPSSIESDFQPGQAIAEASGWNETLERMDALQEQLDALERKMSALARNADASGRSEVSVVRGAPDPCPPQEAGVSSRGATRHEL